MTVYVDDADFTLHHGDVLDVLPTLPDQSVHCVITSPPYWGLRDYGTEGQLGLEQTPDEYVARMVDVFRQVRRVLRDDGTLWLNLGDSYAHSLRQSGSAHAGSKQNTNDGSLREGFKPLPAGMKEKDLVGIPWRVAFALQQPYYAGSIKDERDRIWLAAVIEAEGCLFIHKRKAGQSNGQGYERKNDSYGAGLEVSSTDRVIVERCMEIAGIGSICEQSPEQNERRKQTIYRWNVRSNECREIIRELYPHFLAKQHEARLLLGCPSSGDDAARAHESLKAIHQGGTPSIDFAPPESMFEPGWYLRAEIIWAKKNCMPESVTDRPTKSHEQIFLLSKQPRYWFDQEAVREKYQDGRGLNGGAYSPPGQWPNGGRNVRSVWEIATQPYAEAHFATYPQELVRRCLLAGCPKGGTVLDPFMGSGTTALVARHHGRRSIGIELNADYCQLAAKRLSQQSLLAGEAA